MSKTACLNCGSTKWVRKEIGDYTEDHVLETDPDIENTPAYQEEPIHEWTDTETTVEESQPWKCRSCGTQATEEQEDALSDL